NRHLLRLKGRKNRLYGSILRLVSKPHELLLTILVGNELVNVLISSFGTTLFVELLGSKGVGIAMLLSTLLIFVFGEVLPKNVVLPFTSRLVVLYYLPFSLIHRLMVPVRLALSPLVGSFLRVIEVREERTKQEEFLELFDMGLSLGYFDQREEEVVKRVLSFKETTVKEVMTPKPDLFTLDEKAKLRDVVDLLLERKHSYIPLYSENPDNITGIVHVKDLVPFEENLDKSLLEFKREVLFVPEIMPLTELVKKFRSNKVKVALVVGEYGELAGLVSLYDLVSYTFGKVPEEWEEEILRVSRDMYVVSGWANIEDIAEKLGFSLPEDYEYDTVGGFVMANLSKVPQEGDEFYYE
ncbi:MAG: HlyC/CorC family transporter, partial [Aquificota bacterium]